jgi:hypothetical protein
MPVPGSSTNEAAIGKEGLECIIGKARVALPMEAVQQVLEYEVGAPPPLARKWVGGVGVHGDELLLSVALVPPGTGTAKRIAKGILLRTSRTGIAWAIEVASVGARVEVSLTGKPSPGNGQLPAWIASAQTKDGRPIGWIHVEQMLADLSRDAQRTGGKP